MLQEKRRLVVELHHSRGCKMVLVAHDQSRLQGPLCSCAEPLFRAGTPSHNTSHPNRTGKSWMRAASALQFRGKFYSLLLEQPYRILRNHQASLCFGSLDLRSESRSAPAAESTGDFSDLKSLLVPIISIRTPSRTLGSRSRYRGEHRPP